MYVFIEENIEHVKQLHPRIETERKSSKIHKRNKHLVVC